MVEEEKSPIFEQLIEGVFMPEKQVLYIEDDMMKLAGLVQKKTKTRVMSVDVKNNSFLHPRSNQLYIGVKGRDDLNARMKACKIIFHEIYFIFIY